MDISSGSGTTRGPGILVVAAGVLAAIGIAVGAAGLVKAQKAQKALDQMNAQVTQAASDSAQARTEIQNLSGQISRTFDAVGRDLRSLNDQVQQHTAKLIQLTAPPPKPSPPVAGAGKPPAAGPAAGTGKEEKAGATAGADKVHEVAKGELFGTIAKKYGVTVSALTKANPGVDASKLKVGQKIKIP